MNKPISAYSGTEPYAFVCYSHKNSDSVYSDLAELDAHGIRFWFDEGISAGSSWRARIAKAIQNARQFIFYISDASLNSSHCLREIDYALSHDIEIIPIYLEDCPLPAELDLVLNRVHALFKEKDALYMEHLLGALLEENELTELGPTPFSQKPRLRLPLFLGALALLLIAFWLYRDHAPVSQPSDVGPVMEASAYDHYLDGMELLERWDKDDNLDRAISLFREAVKLDPEFALGYARLANALRLRYAITRVVTWLDEAIDMGDVALRLNPSLAPVQVVIGRIHATQGNYDLAFAALEKALSIDPNDAEANQAMAKVYERQGRLQDAEASFQKALALKPESLLIRDSYANFLSRQSRYEDAEKQWRGVIRAAPDHYGALVNLGSVLNETGNISEAITMYERSIKIRPTYMAYSNLGTSNAIAGRYTEAEAAYLKALEINDTDWLAWGNLAFVYSWMEGMESKATETFEYAIKLAEGARQQTPRDPYVNSDLALYYAKLGQPELALQRLQTSIALSPDSGEIQAAAAEAYEIIGQRDKAIELVEKSLELGYPRQRFQRSPDLAGLLSDPRMQNSL